MATMAAECQYIKPGCSLLAAGKMVGVLLVHCPGCQVPPEIPA